mgnify:CR=1 FL=1
MYAIVKTGGKQYKVAEGDTIFVEKLEAGEGEAVVFDQVLTVVNGADVKIGRPMVDGEGDWQGYGAWQGQEDPGLQVQGEVQLPQASGSSSAVHEGRYREDRGLIRDFGQDLRE